MQSSKKPASTFISSLKPEQIADPALRQRLSLLAPMPEATPDTEGRPADATLYGADAPAERLAADMRPMDADAAHQPFKLKRGRYRRTVRFFTSLFIRIIVWEVLIRRVMGEGFVARGRSQRWRHYSRRFRKLATDMGGVMIKLGQFVSSRVDVLPPEITDELMGLQDQVPIVPFDYIKQTVERELGPLDQRFLWFTPEPVAAASFGQVHRAQLPNGDRVVVKVQRPNINDIVQTDLASLKVVARLAMRYGPIRRRANVPALLDEFARVLWEELDYRKEADHAMIFGSMFKDDPGVYVPTIYLEHSTHFVLTLEDVTSIKLNDYTALEQAGIDRKEVAVRLLNCYLRQIFDERFFHADPHPGNIFIYPLPEKAYMNGNGKKPDKRPFYLIFIDFGMVGRLTPRLQEGLRETLIAVITQDSKALINSYQKLGVLMPSADIQRLEEATQVVFSKVWGLNMNELTNLPFEEMANVAQEFSDLLLSMPFQMPQDFIYLSRAVGILSGMCTGLDPTFDPWRQMQPFTERLLTEQTNGKTPLAAGPRAAVDIGLKLVRDFATRAYRLPQLADTVLSRAERGELSVQIAPNDSLRNQVNRIETAVSQMSLGLIFATMVLASTLLYTQQERTLGIVGYVLAGITFLMLVTRGRGE
jgi:predicted unusual protein kinase regulating ubiquinone biosynthesis (AarF/ABC1/UbiB family)